MGRTKTFKRRDGKPTFWSTRLAAALAGDQPCTRSTWIGGHFNVPKMARADEASLAEWKTNHTQQLQALIAKLKGEGWRCDVERFFKVTGQHAIISGKADLVIQKKDRRSRIIDVKSGEPNSKDVLQVQIEIITIPMAWGVAYMQFDGAVQYEDHEVPVSYESAQVLRPKLFALVKQLGTSPMPDALPSYSACQFCEVPKEGCSERWTEQQTVESATETDLF